MLKGTKGFAMGLAALALALGACQKQAKTAAPAQPLPHAQAVLAVVPSASPSLRAVAPKPQNTDAAYTALHDFMQARMYRQTDMAESFMNASASHAYAVHENGLELVSQTSNPHYAHWFVRGRPVVADGIAFVVHVSSDYTGQTYSDPGFDETIVVSLVGKTETVTSASRTAGS